ncbi:DNA cytosine methyltransferase [Microtetraspora fusca]|uniref:DNA cytosine methyltransferase n=1 Tax=Microtetraspora fusca TaxID=1997 RepID=A0ABW6VI61_MICFU
MAAHDTRERITNIDLFAGPAGWDQGGRILKMRDPIHGYEIDRDACATARAAGFLRTQADVRTLDPEDFPDVTLALISSPCPTLSRSGLLTGTKAHDRAVIMDGIAALSYPGEDPCPAYTEAFDRVTDPRTALLLENIRFGMRLPNLVCLIAEQVPNAHDYWVEMAFEMVTNARFEIAYVLTIHAEDLGLVARRSRTFFIATRDYIPRLGNLPFRSGLICSRFGAPPRDLEPTPPLFTGPTMAQALNWEPGHKVRTRGNMQGGGGNLFSADGPCWCLTGSARSWERDADGRRLTPAEAGVLNGFPPDYPWQGSNSKAFLQIADVVAPPVAAAVLGTALAMDWEPLVRDYLATIYPAGEQDWVQAPLFAA